jgi:methylmalonyl-CoA/ethylmalonyl-CoA epimerase
MKYHHIGIACFDIVSTKAFYEAMGYRASKVVKDPVQDVYISFLEQDGMPRIELLAPVDANSPVNRTLKMSGVTPYHICYEVDNIESSIALLKKQKFLCVKKPHPAVAIDNRKVSFLFKKNVGLIELLESTK